MTLGPSCLAAAAGALLACGALRRGSQGARAQPPGSVAPDTLDALDVLVFTVECLVSPSSGCPWIARKTAADYLQYVCSESEEALEELRALAAAGTGVGVSDALRRQALRRALVAELGDVLYTSLVAVAKAAQCHGFLPCSAYRCAVDKIHFRTPYMRQWGDGSAAATGEEAKAFWMARKKQEKGGARPPRASWPPGAGHDRGALVSTVTCLTARRGCPWTAQQTPERLLGFLKDECAEAAEELAALAEAPGPGLSEEAAREREERLRQALVSEMGDVLFDIYMAIFLAGRQHGFGLADVCASATGKIRGRTPYMPQWGDGSTARTPADAEAHWKARKALEKSGKSSAEP